MPSELFDHAHLTFTKVSWSNGGPISRQCLYWAKHSFDALLSTKTKRMDGNQMEAIGIESPEISALKIIFLDERRDARAPRSEG